MHREGDCRIFWIDNYKAIMILFVIASHTNMWTVGTRPLQVVIQAVPFVPAFFFISGVIHKVKNSQRTIGCFIKHRSVVLLTPYLFFSIYNSVCKLSVLAIQHNLTTEAFKYEMQELLITGNGTVWFLMTLFVAESVFYVIRSLRNKAVMVTLAVGVAIIPFVLDLSSSSLGILFSRILEAFPLIVFGYICGFLFDIGTRRIFMLAVGIFAVALSLFFGAKELGYSFFSGFFSSPWTYMINAYLGSMGFAMIIYCISIKIPVVSYIGKNTLLEMLTHPTFVLIYAYVVLNHLKIDRCAQEWVVSVFAFVVVTLFSIAATFLIKRFLPFVIGQRRVSYE